MSRLKMVLIGSALGLAGAALLAFLFASSIARAPRFTGSFIDPPLAVEDFRLQSAGAPVSLSDFRGKHVVLFFGYTFCPDVCPTTLAQLRQAGTLLEEKADEMQVIMVSVDPERDTPERIGQYASGFNEDFIGLSGSPEEIDAIASRMGIFYARQEGSAATGYLVDHTATTLVLDRNGELVLMWPFGTTGEEMAADLATLMDRS